MGMRRDSAVWDAESEGLDMLETTIGDALDRQAEAYPDHEALVYSYPEAGLELRLTYRRYREEVDRVARGLLALGLEKGEHVALWATNVPEWVLLEMALAKLGAVLVTINTNYRAAELEYVLRQGDVTTLITIPSYRDNSFIESICSIAPELTAVVDPHRDQLNSHTLPSLKRVVLIGGKRQNGFLPYTDLLSMGESVPSEELARRQSTVSPRDVAQIQYTSGTTGFPKGAMLTHYGVINNSWQFTARCGLSSTDRFVTAMPLFHCSGCVCGVLGSMLRAATLIPLITFDAAKQLELVAKEKATYLIGVPTMLIAMLNHPRFRAGEFDTSSLRCAASGGSPVPVSLMEEVKEEMGADSMIVFGQTEASPIITQTLPEDSFELKSTTVGKPIAHIDIKIADLVSGEPVGIGESGELWTRGYLVMAGYYKMPDETARAIDVDGWLHTGDLATMNAEGYVNIVGRLKDMVIRGGENLFPAEIEAFLMRHPSVAEAQVLGLPDALMGEELCALLRLRPGQTMDEVQVRDYCRQGLSRQKHPKYVRFVTEFPLTASGKVKKFELKEQLIKELGLEEALKQKTA